MQYHNDTIIKTQEDFFRKMFAPLTLFLSVRKGCVGFYCERELETEQKLQYFDPTLMAVSVVSFSFSWCSIGSPRAHFAGWWLSLLHLISNFSGPQFIRGAPNPFGLVWLSLPHLVYNSVRSLTADLTSVLTELYDCSTHTQSPTRSLEWHDWSSSSGNNCHAVHRSHSSGASVYEYTMGIFLPRPMSSANFRPRNFLS